MSSAATKAALAVSGLSAKPNPQLLPQLIAAQAKLRAARRVGDAAAATVARKEVMALAKACLPPDVCVSERRAAKTAIAYWLQRAYAARGLSM
ncbi:MAG: hypothetical protein H6747_05040 [Deltaproteobacteria bacterium]|nr:hypothetical protein [Deltaproteobacteria bacterium]